MQLRSIFLFVSLSLISVSWAFSQERSDWKTYTDTKNGVSVSYPSDFKLYLGAKAETENYFGDPGKGTKLFKISPLHIPEKYHGDYEFNIWISTDAKDNCGAPAADEFPNGDPDTKRPKTRTIDGQTFYSYGDTEGGMSKSMGLDGYRGMIGKRCWQIQSVSMQQSAYDDYKSFDDKIIERNFEQFVRLIKFNK